MKTRPATNEELLKLAEMLKADREQVRNLMWEVAKLSFWLAVMRKSHPDQAMMERASAAVLRAQEIPDRAQAIRELLGTSVSSVLTG